MFKNGLDSKYATSTLNYQSVSNQQKRYEWRLFTLILPHQFLLRPSY